ncbi:helix-turn-helix domain-containing protein [Paenibacillus qinlingensis]|uniref:AraC-like DNA-binding protein n=1 Tax=Paenibacillus qinlingensis TaxID=1837343 RepID=A0ABU1NQJ4_9BACL|nr:helix-turn-helix domain-containing protein [Paenibacillus qinlingensis]MDR6549157.1 AraC-like DNA-binding protein [Paenibacillus qinlingensis]
MLFEQFRPLPQLSEYVDSILVQEDFNPINFANRNPVKVLPSTLAVIGIQYGNRMKVIVDRKADLLGTSGLTGLQTTFREYLSTGSVGTIIIRFKPGGLKAFTPYPIHEFQDANIDLHLIFKLHLVSEMEQRLSEATTIADRVAIVQAFLLLTLEHQSEEQLIVQAARQIQQQKGAVSIKQLADDFWVGKRTLERKFKAIIGITPKKFANIVRFQHTLQLKKSGHDYLDIVHACHFNDHAHFAHDFKAFTGCTPEQFFRNEVQPELTKHFSESRDQSLTTDIMYQ